MVVPEYSGSVVTGTGTFERVRRGEFDCTSFDEEYSVTHIIDGQACGLQGSCNAPSQLLGVVERMSHNNGAWLAFGDGGDELVNHPQRASRAPGVFLGHIYSFGAEVPGPGVVSWAWSRPGTYVCLHTISLGIRRRNAFSLGHIARIALASSAISRGVGFFRRG